VKPTIISFPPNTIITHFAQPGFHTGPPNLTHAEIIPAHIRAILQNRWEMVHPQRGIALNIHPFQGVAFACASRRAVATWARAVLSST